MPLLSADWTIATALAAETNSAGFAASTRQWLAEGQTAAWAVNATAVGALALVLLLVLWHWWTRRRIWLEHPERLIEPRPPHSAAHGLIVAACVLVGLAGVARLAAWTTASALLIASVACLTSGHTRRWLFAGVVGLVLLAMGVASLLMACGWTGPLGAMFAVAVAAGYMLWLARFWQQQLRDGVAWTTAGRLIGPARWLSACGSLVLAGYAFVPVFESTSASPTGVAVIVLAVLGLGLLQLRDAADHAPWVSGAGACVSMASWSVPARAALALAGWQVPLAATFALGGLVLAVRKFFMGRRLCAPVVSAYIALLVPGIVLFAWANGGMFAPMLIAVVISVCAIVLVAVAPRGGPRAG